MEIGDTVFVTADGEEIMCDFEGTIVGFKKGYIQVRDQEDNVYDCEPSQIEKGE